jgi:predicted glycosyltransferase
MNPKIKNAIALIETDPQAGYKQAAADIREYIESLERKAEELANVARGAVDHVAAANYPEREREAMRAINQKQDEITRFTNT